MRSSFLCYVTSTLLITDSKDINHHTLPQRYSNEEKVAIGIDVGGTNTVFGFVDEGGVCIYESSILTHADQDADQLFGRLFKKVDDDFKNILLTMN